MTNLILMSVAATVPLLLAGTLGNLRRGALWTGILLVAAIITAAVQQNILLTDLPMLPGWTGLGGGMLLMVLWAVYGALARAAGGARLPGTASFGAVISGALLGELAATAILTANVEDRGVAARMALAASAGGFFGRLGNPAMLLLAEREPDMLFTLVPLGLLCALVVLPGAPMPTPPGRIPVTVVSGITALAALIAGPYAWMAVLIGCVGMGALALSGERETIDWQLPLRALFVCMLVVLSASVGLPELAALGLEENGETVGRLLKPVLAVVGALAAMLGDTFGAGLFAEALLDRAHNFQIPGAAASLAAGVTVGGLGPLLIARAVRHGLLRWGIQIALAVAWAWMVL